MTDMELAEEIERYLAPDATYHHWEPNMADMEQIIAALRRSDPVLGECEECGHTIVTPLKLLPERPPSGEMVMVPREPTQYQIQLIFNTLMGELPEVKPDGWWGTSDQVAEAKKFYSELLSAAEANETNQKGK